jgi:hypothetical protein
MPRFWCLDLSCPHSYSLDGVTNQARTKFRRRARLSDTHLSRASPKHGKKHHFLNVISRQESIR